MSLSFLAKLLAPVTPTPIQIHTGWYRLPGGHLELRGTGYQIHLCSDPKKAPYNLFDPDGRHLAWGHLLQPIKDYAEQAARDRAEFGQ